MKKSICITLLIVLTLPALPVFAQQAVSSTDSVPSLSEVIIQGYESQRRLLETPASVSVITTRDMQRYTNTSLVPALNTIPGVRMEERSPGSYRLSIRGSLLRSPFGIRNVKVYWDDIPFTDAGGNSYFNLIDQAGVSQLEILKGPGGSLYGANTGGVVIMHTAEDAGQNSNDKKHSANVQLTGGSYGLLAESARWKFKNPHFSSAFTQSHIQSDGYRDNTRMRRDLLQWNGSALLSEKDKLSWIVSYTDMFYQTPGGLTLQQMQDNPKQSRPATPALPGAKDQKASIYNKTLLAGISNKYAFNDRWSNVTSAMISYTDFKNPFITNYETRAENNAGLRTKMLYEAGKGVHHFKVAGGLEWLYNYSVINNYGNKQGKRDTIQYKDRISASQVYPFVQGEWEIAKKIYLQAGVSSNFFNYHYRRLTDTDDSRKTKTLDEQILPRFSALFRLTSTLSLYTSASKGFSPPTLAEIRPSEGSIYTSLQPEYGWNREIGLKGNLFRGRFQFDVTAYRFQLQNAIVRRVNDVGAEYFVNAGGTKQWGIEAYVEYMLIRNPAAAIRSVKIWSSGTFNDFSFKGYKTGNDDFSGKALTGIAKYIICSGTDIVTSPGLYLNVSLNITSGLPLNDANSVYAPGYELLQGKLGWKKEFNAWSLGLFAGTDNALNQLYSLGNDINAIGNRYYNPAPLRNYYGGLTIGF
ncbi:MAG: TonB-dependent receptor [Chitinophagaceae bacterium]|nr:TonB-dependent receptor [Chitinophagaceae bacterium]